MNYLLDVNALIVWSWADHPQNLRVDRWITTFLAIPECSLYTSSIVELGFVRVSMQRSNGEVTLADAVATLGRQKKRFGGCLHLLPDDLSSYRDFPKWCQNARHTTDTHLLALAEKHHLQLAPLDTDIPGAFLIP